MQRGPPSTWSDRTMSTPKSIQHGGRRLRFHAAIAGRRYIMIGNGDTAGLHNPAYDFNDEILPAGISYWVRLASSAFRADGKQAQGPSGKPLGLLAWLLYGGGSGP